MTALPTQGGDVGNWGSELNAWLQAYHNSDGSHGPQNGITAFINVRDPAYGAAGDGVANDYSAVQNAINSVAALNVAVYMPKGTYATSQSFTLGSNTTLYGDDKALTTIRAKAGFAASQVGSNQGMVLVAAVGDGSTAQSNITVRDITIDGNQANVTYPLPGYCSQNMCSAVSFTNVSYLTLRNLRVINSIGYAVRPQNCTHVTIENCVITTGQAVVHTNVTQDAIHAMDCNYVRIAGNILNTGNLTNPANGNINVGDDCICIQSIAAGSSHVTISGNLIEASGARGITLVLGGGTVTDVSITGNVVTNTQNEGVTLEYGVYESGSTYLISNVTITGNTFYNLALSGSGRGVTMDDATNVSGHTGPGWTDVVISGNVFTKLTNTGGGWVYVGQGKNVSVVNNNFDAGNVGRGIQVGDNGSSSEPVTGFNISGNIINMGSVTASSPYGIIVVDSASGVISGNVVLGPAKAAGSTGIGLLAVGAAVTGVSVTGNSVSNWAHAITEANSGAAPDYNVFAGNNCHNNTAFLTTVGTHDVSSGNVTA